MTARPLNATAASLLGLLHDGPLSGWELVGRAQVRIGDFWTLTQSQVYRELAAMAAAGLVEVGDPGPRDRKRHTITAAGRAAFREWITADPAGDHVRIPLLLTIAFAGHVSAERLAEMIARQRAEHVERLAGYRAALDAVAADTEGGEHERRTRRATLRYGVAHEEAVVAWLDALPELLELEAASA